MEHQPGIVPRLTVMATALIAFIASWGVFFAVPLAPHLGFGPALFVKILAVILASQGLACAVTLVATGSPRAALRTLSEGRA